jgi:hypothetical protein
VVVAAAGPDGALGRWCARRLGSAVSEVVFEAGSLSTVVGVRLADRPRRRPWPRRRDRSAALGQAV